MEKCDKFLEYIGIAIDGDIIALGGCALTNCSERNSFYLIGNWSSFLSTSATYCSHCENGVKN